MERGGARRLSREFKLAALARMAAGENVSALGRELGVRRKLLYQWRDTVRRGGAEALRGVGRPPAAERLVRAPARLELDFFGQALQLMKEVDRAASVPPDAPASTACSGPGRSGKAD